MARPPKPTGRGATANPAGRFESHTFERNEELPPDGLPKTLYFKDPARHILTRNDSPDVGFDVSINPYRGCETGCSYCYARPTHEYLGLSAGVDFETKIFVKAEAPALLRKELMSPRYTPETIAMSGVTDCYQPVERRAELTRGCLKVLAEFRNPVVIITKNALVARDADLLADLARDKAAAVYISVTSLDESLARRLEPRASRPAERLRAVEALTKAGVPVGIMMAPLIPGLTDHEIPKLLAAARDAGAVGAGHNILRLPYGVKDIFSQWLDHHFPERKNKILNRVREIRGGKLNDPRHGSRMRGEGFFADEIHQLFDLALRRAGFPAHGPRLSTAAFRRPITRPQQLPLL